MRFFRPAAIVLSLHLLSCLGCSAGQQQPATAGGQCQAVLHAACIRAISDCHLSGYPSSVDDCVSQNQPSCCADSCDKTALSSQSDIERCQRAIAAASCDVFDGGGLPPECLHVVSY